MLTSLYSCKLNFGSLISYTEKEKKQSVIIALGSTVIIDCLLLWNMEDQSTPGKWSL